MFSFSRNHKSVTGLAEALRRKRQKQLERTAVDTDDDTSGGGGARISIFERDPSQWPSDCYFLSTDRLSFLNAFPQDSRIRFVEKTHKYYIDGIEAPTSVTSLVHSPFPQFDPRVKIPNMRTRESQYPGMTTRQIASLWEASGKEASRLGTKMHAAIEVALNTGYWSLDPEIQTELHMAREFVQHEIVDKDLEVYRTEPTPFIDPKLTAGGMMLPGSVDCVCRNKNTGEFEIMDWKRVPAHKKLGATMGGAYGYGLPPFDHLEAISFYQYSLQLYVYRYILMRYYHLSVPKSGLYMVSFHPENPTYIKIRAHDVEREAEYLIDHYWDYLKIIHHHQAVDKQIVQWREEPDDELI